MNIAELKLKASLKKKVLPGEDLGGDSILPYADRLCCFYVSRNTGRSPGKWVGKAAQGQEWYQQ